MPNARSEPGGTACELESISYWDRGRPARLTFGVTNCESVCFALSGRDARGPSECGASLASLYSMRLVTRVRPLKHNA